VDTTRAGAAGVGAYTVDAGRGAGAERVGVYTAGAGRLADAGWIGVYTTGAAAGAGCGLAASASTSPPVPSTARLKTAWARCTSNRVRGRLLMGGAYPGLGGLACLEPRQV